MTIEQSNKIMQKSYYYEIQRRVQDFEQQTPIINQTLANSINEHSESACFPSENLLNEYEFIDEDDYDGAGDGDDDLYTSKTSALEGQRNNRNSKTDEIQKLCEDFSSNAAKYASDSPENSDNKLFLNLNFSQICIKSQTKKTLDLDEQSQIAAIDKSIQLETDRKVNTNKKYYQWNNGEEGGERTKQRYTKMRPINFRIEPLQNKEDIGNTSLPAIVLTSYETQPKKPYTKFAAKKPTLSIKSQQIGKSTANQSTPLKGIVSNLSICDEEDELQAENHAADNVDSIMPSPSPPPPPLTPPPLFKSSPESLPSPPTPSTMLPPPQLLINVNKYKTHNDNIKLKAFPALSTFAEVPEVFEQNQQHVGKEQQLEDNNSEVNSQTDNVSTSPESIMDHILSAASSTSVRSSSLSSTGTEIARFNKSVSLSFDNATTAFIDVNRNSSNGNIGSTQHIQQRQQQQLQQQHNILFNDVGSTSKYKTVQSASPTSFTSIKHCNASLSNNKSMLNNNRPLNPRADELLRSKPPATVTTRANAQARTAQLTAVNAKSTDALPSASSLSLTSLWLQPPPSVEQFETTSLIMRSRGLSPAPSNASIGITPEHSQYPEELKCQICSQLYRDPRTLNCLHSFCFQCLIDDNFQEDKSLWSQPPTTNSLQARDENDWKSSTKPEHSGYRSSPDIFTKSNNEVAATPTRPRLTSFSFRRKKSQERIMLKVKSDMHNSESNTSTMKLSAPTAEEREQERGNERERFLICKLCNFYTDIPVGGIRNIPQNCIIMRKVDELKFKMDVDDESRLVCSLCFEEANATYQCVICSLNLCTFCKESHQRQRHTANHTIKTIGEVKRARNNEQQTARDDSSKFQLKCGMHPGFEIKSFCSTCLQIACSDCLVLLHKGHRHENISRARVGYSRVLKESLDQTKPLCNFAEHSLERLRDISQGIVRRCDEIQAKVETFMHQYNEAVEVHRKTLLQQVHRARESKTEMMLEQQIDLEKRRIDATNAIRFYEELMETGSDAEILSFVNILLKRFEYCQQFKTPVDPKISDTLHFLPDIRAPETKAQNGIPLFGIITMQIVEPSLCTLEYEGFSQLRLHKKAEFSIKTHDADDKPLCHGGLHIQAHLKYKDNNAKNLPIEIQDHRDGTYSVSFTPDAQGTIILTVNINEKPIKGSPFSFLARAVRPHNGIYHCCAFCSKLMSGCGCNGRMEGYNGCGHGHPGHPGRRHWSCCGNILENSECTLSNKLLNS